MDKILKKVLMGMILVSLVLCVPIFAEDVSETEASVSVEKGTEVVEKVATESKEMEEVDTEEKIDDKSESMEGDESEVESETEEEPEEEPLVDDVALVSEDGTESETLVDSESEVEKESEDTTESSDESEVVEETTVEATVETIGETTTVSEDSDDTIATISEASEVSDEKCEVVVYWLTDMKLKEQGNGGTYNYSWDKILLDKGSEFELAESIPSVVKHGSCDQEYTLIGFTTENQKDNYWKGADYAGGDVTLDKNFVVDSDIEIYAVYEAKDTYISSIIIDNEVTYKTTTVPNKAIKNICIFDTNDNTYVKNENVKYYKIKNNLNDVNYMFTKDSSEGAPIKACDFSLENYK